ncbi:hypothetical protein PRIPAC_80058 [Pristionchus pacificus]|uniref:Uncharacterized protein n=1 Tax=Pristionchus pacificus TaxID=54126 RepID=A0A2A6CPD2_PRIPA|nr:hypothetical protein PRIPAC_80058 [Pristionchus pacificus]|eukprot:PDM79980.1 hypothetical protein PRIPAC_32559 [Pristionchus pacificus]
MTSSLGNSEMEKDTALKEYFRSIMRLTSAAFFLSTFYGAVAELCFTRVDSLVRRDALDVAPATSQLECNIRCVNMPGCDACMYYAVSGRCTLLGEARAPPPGQCPVQYTCYEKTFSACPVRSPPTVDRGYTTGACTNDTQIVGPPSIRTTLPCGQAIPFPQRWIIDAILHDGTHYVFANDRTALIDWDPNIGSWFYKISKRNYYFKCATCVAPPKEALAPECECAPIPNVQLAPAGFVKLTEKSLDTYMVCRQFALLYLMHGMDATGNPQKIVQPPNEQNNVACRMGAWLHRKPAPYTEERLLDLTCLWML